MPRMTDIASMRHRVLPNQWDLLAFVAILAGLVAMVRGYHGMAVPLPAPNEPVIDLDYWNLPYYALRTTLRMFAALAASLVFTFTYATLAAKSRRAEMVLIPLLDILQSVPILGFLSFTVTFFLGLFPGSVLGAECAAVFVIFTSQAWNMAFSFYQSLRTVPHDLDEVARGLRLTGWQRFWQLEAPFAMPGLIWNMMVSMSGGWFMIVFSEAITVGDTTVTLPGIGSYIAKANEQGRWDAIFAAVVAMALVILAYDQLFFRPIVAWAGKFRVELSASQTAERSWVLDALLRTYWLRLGFQPIFEALRSASLWQMTLPPPRSNRPAASPAVSRLIDVAWILLIIAGAAWALRSVVTFVGTELTFHDVWTVSRSDLVHLVARHRADGGGDDHLGSDRHLDRLAAGRRRTRSADGAVSRRLPRQSAVRGGGRRCPRLPSRPRHLAQPPHHNRHAVVHRVQRDRRRRGLPQRLARSRRELSHPRLGLVDTSDPARRAALLFHRRDHGFGRLLERFHRRRICEVEGPDRGRPWHRRLYIASDGERRFSEDRSRRRDDVDLRRPFQSAVLAPALCLCRTPPAAVAMSP